MTSRLRNLVLLTVTAALLVSMGCENLEPDPEQEVAVETAVRGYLDALAEAYSKFDLTPLDGHATSGEVAEVRKLLRKLVSTGDRLEATLLQVEVVRLQIFREVNATVRLTEVWDVRRIDALTGREKGRNPGAVQDTLIQMRLIDDRWQVTARQLMGGEGTSRWAVATPEPDSDTREAGK